MSMNEYIPADFSPLADWDFRERQKQDGHSAEWKLLSEAVKAGDVPGFKLPNGRWYVHESKAKAHLARVAECAAEPAAKPAATTTGIDRRHVEIASRSLAAMEERLDEIYVVLERLAVAAESIATQPQIQQREQQVREEILSACHDSNSFHN